MRLYSRPTTAQSSRPPERPRTGRLVRLLTRAAAPGFLFTVHATINTRHVLSRPRSTRSRTAVSTPSCASPSSCP